MGFTALVLRNSATLLRNNRSHVHPHRIRLGRARERSDSDADQLENRNVVETRGIRDDTWGERVVVVVQPHAGATVDPDELIAFVKQRIGSVKAPKEVHVWDDLPRSKVGKVLKTEIKGALSTSV